MHVLLARVRGPLATISDIQRPGLIVRAVGAGHEFLVLALEGKPGFEVVFLGGGVVEGAGDDSDDAVGEAEGLVEGFGGVDHGVEGFPGGFGGGEEELFDLGGLDVG